MSNGMESVQDLIEEAKLRIVWWILCILFLTYFMTYTSKSMLMNIPIAVILISGLRILFNEVEFQWKVPTIRSTPYLSYLEKKQLSVNDSRLTTWPSPQKWKRKIDSPIVEAAIEDFINKILHDFVIDLWYSDITPDKEAPQLIHGIVMDALGEVSERIKEVNIVDLFTRDVINLIGDHIDLFRRNQDAIGVDVMRTLSSEERDERLKHHLLVSKELHPALISPECEYKVLQRLMDGVLAIVLRPREAQCPLVRCIAREILTCLVVQPIMDFASPGYINEILEYIIIAYKDWGFKDFSTDQSPNMEGHETQNKDHSEFRQNGQSNMSNLRTSTSFNNPGTDLSLSSEHRRVQESDASGNPFPSTVETELMHSRPADWAKVFDAATQRRTEVLMPENLENMWAIGRNYKKDLPRTSNIADSIQRSKTWSETDDKTSMRPRRPQEYTQPTDFSIDILNKLQNLYKDAILKEDSPSFELESDSTLSLDRQNQLNRSNSTSDVKTHLNMEDILLSKSTMAIIDEYYSSEGKNCNEHNVKSSLDMVLCTEVLHPTKLRCRVRGAYFEKLGSNSFAVYSIAVTDAENNTWFVKRRYRNFERLHRNLKDIPNYTLHLPPKRIFSSSTEDAFVHQRGIQLDKYLQDLMSIANVAEQHEVWDFVSVSSKNYSFGKATSLVKSLTVNLDNTIDDIARQSTVVSGGLERVISGPPSYWHDPTVSFASQNLSCSDDKTKITMRQSALKYSNSFSDNDEGDKDSSHGQKEVISLPKANGWHSDSDLDSKVFPPRVIKCGKYVSDLDTEGMDSRVKSESRCTYPESTLGLTPVPKEDWAGVLPEWTPPNLSVPMLNLVDNIFQLKRRGWLRRQVFWISKQILQLVMEDAIDDCLLRQIQWIRSEEVIAQGIRWVQDILWPDGTFYLRLRILEQLKNSKQNTGEPSGRRMTQPGSFEQQLEAARRANDVRKFIFNGAPTALVSFVGKKQYKRCARDLYYFLQSTISLKQLGYAILELVLIAVFPELGDLVKDIHQKMVTEIDGLS